MPDPVNLAYVMRLEPAEAIAYFESKGYAITWNWWEGAAEAHARAFTVAKATRLDVLQDIREAMRETLTEGLTEQEFIRALEPKLKAQGWWGKQIIVDPSGGAEVVQLGSPHRLRTIYRTNKFSAYQAGRFKRQKEQAEARPYWQYLAIMDSRTRPSHAALHEKVFRHDDPIWDHIYPPNGFNCRCRVRTLSQSRLEREGLRVSSSEGQLSERMVEAGVDKRTGEVIFKPTTVWSGQDARGQDAIFRTDPGFNSNSGQAALWDRVGAMPDCGSGWQFVGGKRGCIRPVSGQPTWRDLGRPDIRRLPDGVWQSAPSRLPPAGSTENALEAIAAAVGLTGRSTLIESPVDQVLITRDTLRYIASREGNREQWANFLLPTLTQPFEVWAVDYGDEIRKRYLALFRDQSAIPILSVIRENADGSLLYNFIRKELAGMNNQRQGLLMWPK